MTELDWEPNPAERTYYRSRVDGQRAYLVRVDGVDMLRLDRPNERIYRPFNAEGSSEWSLDAKSYPISAFQAAKIAFQADREACIAVGEHLEAKKEWLNLHEKERIRFMKHGPSAEGLRKKVYLAVMEALREFTGG